jgi:hypothetical protein
MVIILMKMWIGVPVPVPVIGDLHWPLSLAGIGAKADQFQLLSAFPAPVMGDHPTLALKPEALNLAGMGAEAIQSQLLLMLH